MKLTNGMKSSEFLLTLVVMILATVMWASQQIDSAAAVEVYKWVSAAYAAARGLSKLNGGSPTPAALPGVTDGHPSRGKYSPAAGPPGVTTPDEMLTTVVDSVLVPLAAPIVQELKSAGSRADELLALAVERLRLEIAGNPRVPVDQVPDAVLKLAVSKAIVVLAG